MDMPADIQKPTIGLATALGLTLLLLLKTAVLLSDSYEYGRLALPPVYDDVSYFVDALERVDVFHAYGLRGLIEGLVLSPPHSPYSTLAAFAGFLVSENADGAPYVMNALAIAGLTLFWLAMFRVGPLAAWLFVVMITATDWFDNAVTIYHPDLIAGYGAAVIASLLIFHHEVLTTTRRTVVAGAIAGLVLLTKPTALPMVLVLWAAAFIAGMLASRARGVMFPVFFRRSCTLLVPVIVIAGPYFAIELPEIVRYTYAGFVTQRDTWAQLSAGADPWTFFISRTVEFFGSWLFLGAAALALFAIAAWRGDLALLICFGGVVVCLVIAYIVPTLAPVRVLLYGGVLYGMVLISGLVAVTHLATFPASSIRSTALFLKYPAVSTSFAIIIVGMVAALEMRDGQGRWTPSAIRNATIQFDRVYSILQETAGLPGASPGAPRHISVYFPTVGIPPPHAYRFRGLKEGLDIGIIYPDYGPHQTDVDRVLRFAHAADVVLIPDGRLLTTIFHYPVNALLGELTQRLRNDTIMVESTPVELPDGALLIFRRR
jgi:hypothetical protein